MNSFLLGPILTLMYRVAQINMDFSEHKSECVIGDRVPKPNMPAKNSASSMRGSY